ncbi:MAG TPA: hypothetical protein VH207_10465 [Chthoniobacterales bacterium]|jgi:hypothetical protein|nr:hypothetical protein [Chthoniobacterales bacterium]
MKKPLGFFVFPVLFSLGFLANATTVIPPSFDELVSRADVIFDGEVNGLQSQWIGEGSEHRIVTYVTFKVNQALKGDPGATYSMRMLGGTVDGRTMEVSDAPKFKVGDRDILFVENNGSQFIPLVGIEHGRFRVVKDAAGRETLATNHGHPVTDVNLLGTDQADVPQKAPALSLKDFKAVVKDRIGRLQASGKIQ